MELGKVLVDLPFLFALFYLKFLSLVDITLDKTEV
jgi:hypothetical protein